ncbi:hypothetical protein NPN18_26055, partial [Vibrio parahaemolyticus]|nr:hypothetical protein [Vibrio parahaemolyticus]
ELAFPFLDFEKDKIIDHPRGSFCGRFIAPLYKRLVSIREPSLFFMGFIGTTPLATLCFEAQGLFVKAIIEGKYKLPSQNEML